MKTDSGVSLIAPWTNQPPDGLVPGGASPVCTQDTLPDALQAEHTLAPGHWAVLNVIEGSLRFVNLETGEERLSRYGAGSPSANRGCGTRCLTCVRWRGNLRRQPSRTWWRGSRAWNSTPRPGTS